MGATAGPVYGYTPEQVMAPFVGPFTAMGGARVKLSTPVRVFGRKLGVEVFVVPPPGENAYGVGALMFVFE